MTIHNIIDISPIYHRFAYKMRLGNGTDIPIMYFVLREVERLREDAESRGARVTTSACFDSKGNLRKQFIKTEESEEYKSGRKSILTEEDFKDIETMKQIMSDSGINVMVKDGCEADDIMAKVAVHYNEQFALSVLYSTDKDIMVNVRDGIGMRRLTNGVWRSISQANFSAEAEGAFKTTMPYNALGMYLSTVGDSADKIPGIKKFGPKAFEKMILKISGDINFTELVDYDNVAVALKIAYYKGALTQDQFKQAVESYNMVRNINIIDDRNIQPRVEELGDGFKKISVGMELPSILKISNTHSRIAAYTNAGMKSLAK